jgi:hypothetical protein
MQNRDTLQKHTSDHGRRRFNDRTLAADPAHNRHRTLNTMLRPPIVNRFCPDWFSLRIWEDDGGGQAQLS